MKKREKEKIVWIKKYMRETIEQKKKKGKRKTDQEKMRNRKIQR